MKRKVVMLLFVCGLGIGVSACGNEATDVKEHSEVSGNELIIDEDDSADEDYAETPDDSSNVNSSTSRTTNRYRNYMSNSSNNNSNTTTNNSSEETHGYDPSDPYYSAHDTDGDGRLTDEEWSAAMGDFIDDLAVEMGIE